MLAPPGELACLARAAVFALCISAAARSAPPPPERPPSTPPPAPLAQAAVSTPLRQFVLSPDRRLVAAWDGSSCGVWEIASGRLLGRVAIYSGQSPGPGTRHQWATFSRDGSMLALGDDDPDHPEGMLVKAFRIADGKLLVELRRPHGPRYSEELDQVRADFSPDGKTFAVGARDQILLIDLASGARRSLPALGLSSGPLFGATSSELWFASASAQLRSIELKSGEPRLALQGAIAELSADHQRVLGCAKQGCTLWSASSGALVRDFPDAGGRQTSWPHRSFGLISAKGEVVVFPHADGLRIASAASGQRLLDLESLPSGWAISPGGKRLAALVAVFPMGGAHLSNNYRVELYDIATARKLNELTTDYTPLAFMSDELLLALLGGHLAVIDVAHPEHPRFLSLSPESITAVARSDDGRFFAASGSRLHLWDLQTGAHLSGGEAAHEGPTSLQWGAQRLLELEESLERTFAVPEWTVVRLWEPSRRLLWERKVRGLIGARLADDGQRVALLESPPGDAPRGARPRVTVLAAQDQRLLFEAALPAHTRLRANPDGVLALGPGGAVVAMMLEDDELGDETNPRLWLLDTAAPGKPGIFVKGEVLQGSFADGRFALGTHEGILAVDAQGRTALSALGGEFSSSVWLERGRGLLERPVSAYGVLPVQLALLPISGDKPSPPAPMTLPEPRSFDAHGLMGGTATITQRPGTTFWSLASGGLAGTLLVFNERDYVIFTPDGQFEGTDAAAATISLQTPKGRVPLASRREQLESHGLLARLLGPRL